jgi:hypothetical protein
MPPASFKACDGFDLWVGVDWSGALPAKGVAVAVADATGLTRPVLPPDGARAWTRRAAADWLIARMAEGTRLLAGLDFAFSMPYAAERGYLDGRLPGVDSMFGLWREVERASGNGADLSAIMALDDPAFAPSFWRHGPRPADWDRDKQRLTEKAAARSGAGRPVSVFHLTAGPKQVGKASLAGMRTLLYVQRAAEARGLALAFWPAMALQVGGSAIMEIYPTLFRKQALGQVRKIVDVQSLTEALAFYGCACDVMALGGPLDDHWGDAMIAAAGLLRLSAQSGSWEPLGMDALTARREGWIFGVHDA